MSRVSIQDRQAQKHYYREHFRLTVKLLMYSFLLMVILSVLIIFYYISKPTPDYYATNSSGFIRSLKAMNAPNESSTALLKPEPVEEVQMKKLEPAKK